MKKQNTYRLTVESDRWVAEQAKKQVISKNREEKIQTGFRVSESLNYEIECLAGEYEISKNALTTLAVRLGLNALKGVNQIQTLVE